MPPTSLTRARSPGRWAGTGRAAPRTVPAHRVSVPATYVWGSRDSFLGRAAAELTREHVRGAYSFVELDDNHWLPERRPEECAAAVIARVRAGSMRERRDAGGVRWRVTQATTMPGRTRHRR